MTRRLLCLRYCPMNIFRPTRLTILPLITTGMLPFCSFPGKRVCLGEALARMEVFLFFVSLFQKYTVSVPPGHVVPEPIGVLSITNMPKPFHILLEKRYDW